MTIRDRAVAKTSCRGKAPAIRTWTLRTLTVTDAATFNNRSRMVPTVALSKIGCGTFELAGANTYSGNTTVDGGTLTLASSGKLRFVIGANGVEYVLGGTALTNDLGKLPSVSAAGTDLVFTFLRDQNSKTADTSVEIEVGTDLADWLLVYTVGDTTASSSSGVTITDNLDGTDTVTLTVTKAPDAKKFARLKVSID